MSPSWIVIGCLTGRGLVKRRDGGWGGSTPFFHFTSTPSAHFLRPNPPQLPKPRWRHNTKMYIRAFYISHGHVGQILFQKFWHTHAKLKFQYNYLKKV